MAVMSFLVQTPGNKRTSLLGFFVSDEGKSFIGLTLGVNIVKHFTWSPAHGVHHSVAACKKGSLAEWEGSVPLTSSLR